MKFPLSKIAFRGFAALYLLFVFLSASKSKLPENLLPRPALFFTQTACLFPKASVMRIDYRIEVRSCDGNEWREVDHKPLFPIHADDKENRYYRSMFFHRRSVPVMRELDDYIWTRLGEPGTGQVRLLSLRIAFPEFGSDYERYQRKGSLDYADEERRVWWLTEPAVVARRCGVSQ